jgi:hypothetical protein
LIFTYKPFLPFNIAIWRGWEISEPSSPGSILCTVCLSIFLSPHFIRGSQKKHDGIFKALLWHLLILIMQLVQCTFYFSHNYKGNCCPAFCCFTTDGPFLSTSNKVFFDGLHSQKGQNSIDSYVEGAFCFVFWWYWRLNQSLVFARQVLYYLRQVHSLLYFTYFSHMFSCFLLQMASDGDSLTYTSCVEGMKM